ncbi:MAG: competence protein ComEA [Bryobacterales bacterium]|jgi:competence protein ComEA|nr:competence protein ComEA [Bryobacterales bacterium]
MADDIVLPAGKAKTLIENTCTECHGLDQVVNNAMSSDAWRTTVKSMVKKGATLSPEEIDTVVDYLSVYFAPEKVNVNTSAAPELQAALGITPAEAAAVVQYRKDNGNFKDLAGLQKVAGLDAKKIDAKKDLIVF